MTPKHNNGKFPWPCYWTPWRKVWDQYGQPLYDARACACGKYNQTTTFGEGKDFDA